ncbi:MAG: tRNA uridine-5-carboxymethylaminomethyl(34) synthesis GTPase MnmE [Bacteroidales bacterium]|jgi:tRNA modification GTPase|nr:tRNA uridine-5-carboxymethylaminomethyl(34) synthesis GTPase MnmE [Bacteroidales bacterium]
MSINNTICAISSPAGVGAIAIIRLSGENSFNIASAIISQKQKFLKSEPNKLIFTEIISEDKIIDEVLITKFQAPYSFTGENMVEIYCHGSEYIQKEILYLLIKNGAEIAEPGEYTKRAFLNGKMDLSQSEAVADLISSQSSESHRIAINQMKGNISNEISDLREKMIELVSLMELELDFGEEDVEFADRTKILEIIDLITAKIKSLTASFKYGNAIKSGVPITIAGEPNVGKSTLLNALLNEERAIVSSIPGTTRDSIEEELILDGIKFRIIDTAGIRKAGDEIEEIGIQRTYDKISKSQIIILMLDANSSKEQQNMFIGSIIPLIKEDQHLIIAINKIDKTTEEKNKTLSDSLNTVHISAKEDINIDILCSMLVGYVKSLKGSNDVIITSVRHIDALNSALDALERAKLSLEGQISGDLVSLDIREAMYYLGEISGNISNEEVLGAIFQKFCIGK